jgi:outer membrane cobalamin receptor
VEGSFLFRPEDIPASLSKGHYVQLYDFGNFITEEIRSDELVRRPSLMFNADLRYQTLSGWSFGGFGRMVGVRPDIFYQSDLGPFGALATSNVGAFSTLDGYIGKSFSTSWNAVLRIENVLNNKYSEINGFATRGRGLYLHVQYSFRNEG